ncbi:MAG TPA: hypothetical protein VHB21_01165 [Minicystis sp.]|nr:hypothetical protein [Minicystis sp.]
MARSRGALKLHQMILERCAPELSDLFAGPPRIGSIGVIEHDAADVSRVRVGVRPPADLAPLLVTLGSRYGSGVERIAAELLRPPRASALCLVVTPALVALYDLVPT